MSASQGMQPRPDYPSPSASMDEVHEFLLNMMWYTTYGTTPVTPTSEHQQLVKRFAGRGAGLYEMSRDEFEAMFEIFGLNIFNDLHLGSPWGMVSNSICQVYL